MGEHLGNKRKAEFEHVVVARTGEEASTPVDAAATTLYVAVRPAREPRGELVRPPAPERQMSVAIHEAGDDGAGRPDGRGGSLGFGQQRRGARMGQDAVAPGESRAMPS